MSLSFINQVIYRGQGRNVEHWGGVTKGSCPQLQIPGTDLPSEMCTYRWVGGGNSHIFQFNDNVLY